MEMGGEINMLSFLRNELTSRSIVIMFVFFWGHPGWAITPQQYCEKLQFEFSKTNPPPAKSYEALNVEFSYPIYKVDQCGFACFGVAESPMQIRVKKYCHGGRFMYVNTFDFPGIPAGNCRKACELMWQCQGPLGACRPSLGLPERWGTVPTSPE